MDDVEAEEVAIKPDRPDDATRVSAVHVTNGEGRTVDAEAEDGRPVPTCDTAEHAGLTRHREHSFAVFAAAHGESMTC